MFSEVDELDRSNLACIFGRNIGGTAPVHFPIPRMRQLLANSEHLIALVDDHDKVLALPFSTPYECIKRICCKFLTQLTVYNM